MPVLSNILSNAFFRFSRHAASCSWSPWCLLILNYLSSVGSLVSVLGVIIFFYMLWDAINTNTVCFQRYNNYYIALYNHWFLMHILNSSFTKNLYVFKKYNFFSVYNKSYFYLDRYILSMFLDTVNDIVLVTNMPDWCNFTIKYGPYSKLFESLKLDPVNLFLNTLLLLISGWVSILMGFFISKEMGTQILRFTFYGLIVNFLRNKPVIISSIMYYIIRVKKNTNALLWH